MKTLKILESLKNPEIDRKKQNKLIEICFKISLNYVRLNIRKLYRQLYVEGDTFEEIAIEAITPLFLPTNEYRFQIIKVYEKWSNNIKNEEDSLYFLNKIVSRRVSQHITRMLKDSDPFFAKIFDSINYLINKNGYKKQNYFGTIYIVKDNISSGVIDENSFNSLPSGLFLNGESMLENLFGFLTSETEYSPAIPVNLLVKKLKYLKFGDLSSLECSGDGLLKYEINETIDLGLNIALEKLHNYYYNTSNILDLDETKLFEKTLNDLAFDLKDGGIRPGLYEYLKKHKPDLDKDLYRIRYQNILEYLLKVLKRKVAREINK